MSTLKTHTFTMRSGRPIQYSWRRIGNCIAKEESVSADFSPKRQSEVCKPSCTGRCISCATYYQREQEGEKSLSTSTMLPDTSQKAHHDCPKTLAHVFRCLTIDVISDVAFGHSLNTLGNSNGNSFESSFLQALDVAAYSIWDMMFFPQLRVIAGLMPPGLTMWLGGPAAHFARQMEVTSLTIPN